MKNLTKLKAKVWVVTKSGQKIVTIPKHSNIEDGDIVEIQKIEDKDVNKEKL